MKKIFSLCSSQAFLVSAVPIIHGWLLLVLILCVLPPSESIRPILPHFDKIVHGFMYAIPAFLVAVTDRVNWKWIAYLIAFGIVIEIIQSFLSYRSGDIYDVCANTTGVLLGWWIGSLIRSKLGNT